MWEVELTVDEKESHMSALLRKEAVLAFAGKCHQYKGHRLEVYLYLHVDGAQRLRVWNVDLAEFATEALTPEEFERWRSHHTFHSITVNLLT